MQTSVWREILDDSISGDKIHGGVIDYLDSLDTEILHVPSQTNHQRTGTGTIDGAGFSIGFLQKIGFIGAHDFVAQGNPGPSANFIVNNTSGLPVAKLSSIGNASILELFDESGSVSKAKLTGASNGINYLINRLVIGQTTPLYPAVYGATLLDVAVGIYSPALLSEDTKFRHPSSSAVVSCRAWYAQYLGYKIYLDTIAALGIQDVPAEAFDSLSNMGTDISISHEQWELLGLLDQDVSNGADVAFGRIDCNEMHATSICSAYQFGVSGTGCWIHSNEDITADGDISAVGDVNGDTVHGNLLTTVNGMKEHGRSVAAGYWEETYDITQLNTSDFCFNFYTNNTPLAFEDASRVSGGYAKYTIIGNTVHLSLMVDCNRAAGAWNRVVINFGSSAAGVKLKPLEIAFALSFFEGSVRWRNPTAYLYGDGVASVPCEVWIRDQSIWIRRCDNGNFTIGLPGGGFNNSFSLSLTYQKNP